MKNSVVEIVEKLIAVQASLAALNTSDRMLSGEMLASAFKNNGVLDSVSCQNSEVFMQYDIQAGALGISIHASHGSQRNVELLDSDSLVDWFDNVFGADR